MYYWTTIVYFYILCIQMLSKYACNEEIVIKVDWIEYSMSSTYKFNVFIASVHKSCIDLSIWYYCTKKYGTDSLIKLII